LISLDFDVKVIDLALEKSEEKDMEGILEWIMQYQDK